VEKQKTTANTSLPAISNLSLKNSNNRQKVDKATSVENVPKNNQEDRQNKQNRGNAGDLVLHRRNDFLHRLESEMTKNPAFEQRLQAMLRVWTEDSSVPPAIYRFIFFIFLRVGSWVGCYNTKSLKYQTP